MLSSDPIPPGAPLRVAAAHPRLVLGAWLVVVLGAVLLVLRSVDLTVDDPAFVEQAMALGQRLSGRAPDILAGGTSYFLTGDESLVSTDRRATVMPLLVRDLMVHVERLRQIVCEAAAEGPLEVPLIGSASLSLDYRQLAEEDLRTELRVGLPVAVLLDATLVRLVLLPASMTLLGAGNGWLPGWLERLLPR